MAKKAETEDDELLAGKSTKAKGNGKATAKVAAKSTSKAKKAKADAEDDPLEGKKAAKAKGKGAAAKKTTKKAKEEEPKVRQRAEDIADTDDVRAALLKCKKFTTYADIQAATGFNIRQIRRTARAMRDNNEVELQKEGTIVSVKRA